MVLGGLLAGFFGLFSLKLLHLLLVLAHGNLTQLLFPLLVEAVLGRLRLAVFHQLNDLFRQLVKHGVQRHLGIGVIVEFPQALLLCLLVLQESLLLAEEGLEVAGLCVWIAEGLISERLKSALFELLLCGLAHDLLGFLLAGA